MSSPEVDSVPPDPFESAVTLLITTFPEPPAPAFGAPLPPAAPPPPPVFADPACPTALCPAAPPPEPPGLPIGFP